MQKVIITGAFRFPDLDAAGIRVQGLGYLFKDLGFDVVFWGWESPRNISDLSEFNGFKFCSMGELDGKRTSIFKRLYSFIFKGSFTYKNLKSLNLGVGDIVVVYNSQFIFLLRVFFLAKIKGFKILCDCTEWYDGSHLPGGMFGPANIDNLLRLYVAYPLIGNLVVISKFLESFYKRMFSIKSFLLPPVFKLNFQKDVLLIKPSKITFIYVGSPGKKDNFDLFIKSLNSFYTKKIEFEVFILGPGIDFFISRFGKEYISLFEDRFLFVGKIPNREVINYYNLAHYSILFRENIRSNNAGFSIKFVESCCHGVPVLCNDTSDISYYYSGISSKLILPTLSIEAMDNLLSFIFSMTYDQYFKYQVESRRIAEKYFDYRNYVPDFSKFVSTL